LPDPSPNYPLLTPEEIERRRQAAVEALEKKKLKEVQRAREAEGLPREDPNAPLDERSHGERDYDARHDPESAHYIAPERDPRNNYPGYADPGSENYLQRPELREEEIVSREELPESAAAPTPRRANRITAMQFLYMCEASPPAQLTDALYQFFTTQEQERDFYAFGEELAHGAWENLAAVDAAIRRHAANWTMERIAKVDLAILRLAIYELLFRRDIPPVVTINEAVDLSKAFSTPDAKRFINGILDKLSGTLDRPLRSADV
ncbi:MAG: transcription antitermination factor NusB, partial [Verrucomicrobiota bacterium]